MGKFKEFVEATHWESFVAALSTGIKTYAKKRREPPQPKAKEIQEKIVTAQGEELAKLVAQIVDNDFTIKNGEVKEPSKDEPKKANDWLTEMKHVQSQRRHRTQKT